MILCRNIQRRRTLRWPIFPGVAVQIAAGDSFLIHESDFAAVPGLGDALEVMIGERMVEIEDLAAVPVLH